MEPVEVALVERLAAVRDAADVPPDLAARVIGTVRRRRRRRWAVATAAAAAVLATVPLALVVRAPAPTNDTDNGSAKVVLSAALEARMDRTRALAPVPIAQDGGEFRVEALGSDGTLIGGIGIGVDTWNSPGDRVGIVTRGSTRVRWLTDDSAKYWARTAGDGVVAWTAQPLGGVGESDLMCAAAAEDWRPVRLGSAGGSGRGPSADGTVVAWTAADGRAWVSEACGPPRQIGEGHVMAVSGSVVYRRAETGRTDEVHLTDGDEQRLADVPEQTSFLAAADDTVVAAQDGELVIFRGGAVREVRDTEFSAQGGFLVDLTVGRRIAVYSVRSASPQLVARWGTAVVVDLDSGAHTKVASEAYAAGDYLAWREGDHYQVAPVGG